jgi:hypothetical protein
VSGWKRLLVNTVDGQRRAVYGLRKSDGDGYAAIVSVFDPCAFSASGLNAAVQDDIAAGAFNSDDKEN